MNRQYNFPSQLASRKVKETDTWKQEMVREIFKLATFGLEDTRAMLVNYDLYNGIISEEDFLHITNPYGDDVEMPVKLNHFDIITSKLKLLEGENAKRPLNFRVKAVNEFTIHSALEEQKQMLFDLVKQDYIERSNAVGDLQQQEADPQAGAKKLEEKLKEFQKYITYSYKEISEKVAQELLEYIIKYNDVKRIFAEGFKDKLVVGKEIYWIGIENGMPVLRNVNPVYFSCDKNHNSPYIHEAQWATYTEFLLPSEVVRRYGSELTDAMIEWIDNGDSNRPGKLGADKIEIYRYDGFVPIDGGYLPYQTGIKITTMEWVSLRKVGFFKFVDEKGQQQEIIVDEDFEAPKNANIDWRHVPEIYEAIVMHDDMIIRCGPKANQYRSIDNPFSCSLSFVGMITDDRNSKETSLMDRMKPYQYEFDIMMFRLEAEVAKSRGKKIIYDLAQMPSSIGENAASMDQWLYYMDVLGIVFINSREQDERGQYSAFNQFREFDMSLSSGITQILEICRELDYRCERVSGVTSQREGQIGKTELATNAERAVVQSSHITEKLFQEHDKTRLVVMEKLLETAKVAFKDGNKKVLTYVTDDLGVKTLTFDPAVFVGSDYGLFMSSSTKDDQLLTSLKQIAQIGVQNGSLKMSDLMVIHRMDNIYELQNEIERKEMEAEQRQQQAQQQANEIEQQRMQAEAEARQLEQQMRQQEMQFEREKMTLEREKLELEERKNIRDNNTKIYIEQLKLGLARYEIDVQQMITEDQLALQDKQLEMTAEESEANRMEADKDRSLKEKEIASKEKIAKSKPKPTSKK